MAFMGVLFVIAGLAAAVLLLIAVPMAVGTHLLHHTRHRRLGIALRIFSYFMLCIPVTLLAALFITNILQSH